MNLNKGSKLRLESALRSVPGLFLEMADWVYSKVEYFKISLKNNELERETDRNVALLGEMIFKTREFDFSSLKKDPILSERIGRIARDQNQISKRVNFLHSS